MVKLLKTKNKVIKPEGKTVITFKPPQLVEHLLTAKIEASFVK